jgi:hypothetical protein
LAGYFKAELLDLSIAVLEKDIICPSSNQHDGEPDGMGANFVCLVSKDDIFANEMDNSTKTIQ